MPRTFRRRNRAYASHIRCLSRGWPHRARTAGARARACPGGRPQVAHTAAYRPHCLAPRSGAQREAGARSAPGEGRQGFKHGAAVPCARDPLPPTFGRRPLPLRGRGDTAAAAAEEWEFLCRDASPAQDLRTKIWVTMSPDGERHGSRFARFHAITSKAISSSISMMAAPCVDCWCPSTRLSRRTTAGRPYGRVPPALPRPAKRSAAGRGRRAQRDG